MRALIVYLSKQLLLLTVSPLPLFLGHQRVLFVSFESFLRDRWCINSDWKEHPVNVYQIFDRKWYFFLWLVDEDRWFNSEWFAFETTLWSCHDNSYEYIKKDLNHKTKRITEVRWSTHWRSTRAICSWTSLKRILCVNDLDQSKNPRLRANPTQKKITLGAVCYQWTCTVTAMLGSF